MEIDSKLLIDVAKKNNLTNKEHIEKSWMQDHLLYYLSKKRDDLIFKGGTALYKFYSLPRFSEDLDFTTNKDINGDLLNEFCEKNNISLKYKKIKDSYLFKLIFEGKLTQKNTIQIDINITKKKYPSDEKEFISFYPDVLPFITHVMPLEEIFAEKIHAILNRNKSRDLFDLFFLLRIVEINEDFLLIKLKDKGIDITKSELKERLIKKIDDYSIIWEEELKHFVLSELPDFKIVKNFVIKKMDLK